MYADRMFRKIGCMDNCAAFIYRNVIEIITPDGNDLIQSFVYHEQKNKHASGPYDT